MILLHRLLAVPQNLIHRLDHAVRRQTAVLLAQVHAPPGGVHPHAQVLRRGELGIQQGGGAFAGEDIVVVENCGAPGFQQLPHAHGGAVVNCIAVQILPNFIQRPQPAEQLQVLHLGQVAAEGLVEMMVGIDESRIDNTARGVQDLVRLLGFRPYIGHGPVSDENTGVFQHGILFVTGDNGRGVFHKKTAHALPPKYAVSA